LTLVNERDDFEGRVRTPTEGGMSRKEAITWLANNGRVAF
jgi:hypothetical protein